MLFSRPATTIITQALNTNPCLGDEEVLPEGQLEAGRDLVGARAHLPVDGVDVLLGAALRAAGGNRIIVAVKNYTYQGQD